MEGLESVLNGRLPGSNPLGRGVTISNTNSQRPSVLNPLRRSWLDSLSAKISDARSRRRTPCAMEARTRVGGEIWGNFHIAGCTSDSRPPISTGRALPVNLIRPLNFRVA